MLPRVRACAKTFSACVRHGGMLACQSCTGDCRTPGLAVSGACVIASNFRAETSGWYYKDTFKLTKILRSVS